jgi:hypothetical protein
MNDEALVGPQFGGELTVSASDMNNQAALNSGGLQDFIRLLASSGHNGTERNKHNDWPQHQSAGFHYIPFRYM